MVVAHNKMAERSETIMAILREMVAAEGSGMSCMSLAAGSLKIPVWEMVTRETRDSPIFPCLLGDASNLRGNLSG